VARREREILTKTVFGGSGKRNPERKLPCSGAHRRGARVGGRWELRKKRSKAIPGASLPNSRAVLGVLEGREKMEGPKYCRP